MKKSLVTPEGTFEIEMTAEEIAQRQEEAIKAQADATARQQAQAKKDADALAGNNKLLELGLTQAQVTAMTGYTPPVSE